MKALFFLGKQLCNKGAVLCVVLPFFLLNSHKFCRTAKFNSFFFGRYKISLYFCSGVGVSRLPLSILEGAKLLWSGKRI